MRQMSQNEARLRRFLPMRQMSHPIQPDRGILYQSRSATIGKNRWRIFQKEQRDPKSFTSRIVPAVPLKWRPVGENKTICSSIKMEIMMQTTKNQCTFIKNYFRTQTPSAVAGNFFSFTSFGSRIERQKVLHAEFVELSHFNQSRIRNLFFDF